MNSYTKIHIFIRIPLYISLKSIFFIYQMYITKVYIPKYISKFTKVC